MKYHFKKRLKRFVDLTTMHGFSDIYYAKSLVGKFFWVVLVIFASVSSGFEINNIILDYVNVPTTTVMQTLKDSNPFYPPLRICYIHWLQFLDWRKSQEEFGFTNESLLYGMSYLTDIYSKTQFDVDKAKWDWINGTDAMNATTFSEVYIRLAYDTPPNFKIRDSNVSFTKTLFAPRTNAYRLCYELDFEKINFVLNDRRDQLVPQSSRRLTLYYTGDSSYIFQTVSEREYDLYAKSLLISLILSPEQEIPLDALNLTDFKTPPLVNFDGNIELADTPTFDSAYIYYIKLSGSVFNWLNTDAQPCRPVRSHYSGYENCPTKCMSEVLRSGNTTNSSLTYFEAIINGSGLSFDRVINRSISFDLSHVTPNDDYQLNVDTIEMAQSCIRSRCTPACEEWLFRSTVSNSPASVDLRSLGYKTEIEVEYPPHFAILLHTEVRTQTWDSFVADIGGVLGLWLGASVLSFFQALHIFFGSYHSGEEELEIKK